MKCKHNEEFVYQSVLAGDIEIMPDGTIWRVRKRGWDRWQQRAVSRPCKRVRAEHDCGEYFQVRAMINGKRVEALAHRLVYFHFKGQIPGDLTVNHEDGNKKHNDPINLTLATMPEQLKHVIHVLGKNQRVLHQFGEDNHASKLTIADVIEIRRRRDSGERLNAIAKDYDIAFQTVSKIARGYSWRFGVQSEEPEVIQ